MMTTDRICLWTWKVATIDERLSIDSEPLQNSANSVQLRILKWRQRAADFDDDLFRARLSLDALTSEDVSRVVADATSAPHTPPAAWLEDFAWIYEALCHEPERDELRGLIDPKSPSPFEELFVTLVTEAGRRAGLNVPLKNLNSQAVVSLQHLLIRRLTSVCGGALFEQFSLYRSCYTTGQYVPLAGSPSQPHGRDVYLSFLRALRQHDLCDFFDMRPVLARLITVTTCNWINCVVEFINRLWNDMEFIRVELAGGCQLGQVKYIYGDLSDSHNDGRTVWKIVFTSNIEIGYKPKDLGIDSAWRSFCDWLSLAGAPLSCLAPRVLERGEYGWVQWVTPTPCSSIEQVSSFFYRAGAMLSAIHFWAGTDFHAENIIAASDVPIPIDLETLLHPWLPGGTSNTDNNATAIAASSLRESVLATYYLPTWGIRPDDTIVNVGGLGPNDFSLGYHSYFSFVNTDDMTNVAVPGRRPPSPNLPTFEGAEYTPETFASAVECGFRNMYNFLLDNRSTILAESGPLSFFVSKRVRILLRGTMVYKNIITQSLRNHVLSNAFEWSSHFEYLSLMQKNGRWRKLHSARIQKAERQSLAALDIPYFSAFTDSRDLQLPDGTFIEDFFSISGIDQIRQQAKYMSEAHLQRQLRYIRLACCEAYRDGTAPTIKCLSGVKVKDSTKRISQDEAVQISERLALILEEEAFLHKGSAAWIGALPIFESGKARLEVVGHGLYSGGAGIGLFLSAIFLMSRNYVHKQLAVAAFNDLRHEFQESEHLAQTFCMGGGNGLGSIIYSLSRASVMLEEPTLLDEAVELSKVITNEWIKRDRFYDIMIGSAGTLLGLLALYRLRPDRSTLDRARACGMHLVENQENVATGGGAWRTVAGQMLTGMSHGSSGILLALERLHRLTGDVQYLRAVRQAMQYERSLFVQEARNWPDFRGRRNEFDYLQCQWCHGATGIGFGRLACLGGEDDESIFQEINDAIQTTLEQPMTQNDDLCCGNFGRIEFLHTAGIYLSQPTLVNKAQLIACELVRRASRTGDFQWKIGSSRENPGFYTGIAGVGYQLLRLAAPQFLPCVLLWE